MICAHLSAVIATLRARAETATALGRGFVIVDAKELLAILDLLGEERAA